ncbi:redoxin domain-containing protein [Rossellomorea marisflavi]|uniref:peroxiredoxin family protein n=1 Tax=Rossellomorea marisflavi TaxID=189381 RepID=UPI0034598213
MTDQLTLYLALLALVLVVPCFVYLKKARKGMSFTDPNGVSGEGFSSYPAPDFSLNDTKGNIHDLKDLIQKGLIIVFVDSTCTHCDNNLEEFIYDVGYKHQKNFVVISGESDVEKSKKISGLYDDQFLVLQGNDELFKHYQVTFLPAFYYIDGDGMVRHSTPVPYQMLHVSA